MPNDDLIKWVTSDTDFYELLGLTFETFSASELRRAYRKTALKYHPDKVGKDFDPAKYELFQAANDILSDEELKTKYDNHRNAKIQRERANALFEGKRRQMKEDLEARERNGAASLGAKRQREEDEMSQELKRLAEEGRKRRAARQSMMAMSNPISPPPAPAPTLAPASASKPPPYEQAQQQDGEEDEIERLERRIREAIEAKAQRKAEKKARKSGIFVPLSDSPSVTPDHSTNTSMDDTSRLGKQTETPTMNRTRARPAVFSEVQADEVPSASPRFTFSPSLQMGKDSPMANSKSEFVRTMERLKAAERERKGLEEEIRRDEERKVLA